MRPAKSFVRPLLGVSFALVGCGGGGERFAICLYEHGECDYGALGGECPPGLDDFETRCVDLPAAHCPERGRETEVDTKQGQAYSEYVVNPRVVESVTCEDYAADPKLDPDPWQTTCETEMNGVCDAPKRCPDGTDVLDCADAPCVEVAPNDDDCGALQQDALYCGNLEGGARCAEVGALYHCDDGVWVQADVYILDLVCDRVSDGSYKGCSGAFETFSAYCQ